MLRDIKQKFDPKAPMVMNRSMKWAGKWYHRGDPIPEELRTHPGGKFRLFWSSGAIQRSDWDPKLRRHVEITTPKVSDQRQGGWYTVTYPDGTQKKVRGKAALEELLAGEEE